MSYWHSDGLRVYGDGEDIHLWVYRRDHPNRPPAQTDGKAARDAAAINGIRMPEAVFEEFIVSVADRLRGEGKLDSIRERLKSKGMIEPENVADPSA